MNITEKWQNIKLGKMRKVDRQPITRPIMSDVPTSWYAFLSLVSIFGVLTWYLDNFSDKDNLKRISGICGAISMISLLYITFTSEAF